MKNCLIHFYVQNMIGAFGTTETFVCAECGVRHYPEDRPILIRLHAFLGRVVRKDDDDYNEWADLAMEARGRFLRGLHK